MMEYKEFFCRATELERPYPYQEKPATKPWPVLPACAAAKIENHTGEIEAQ